MKVENYHSANSFFNASKNLASFLFSDVGFQETANSISGVQILSASLPNLLRLLTEQKAVQQSSQRFRIFRAALPNDQNPPAFRLQFLPNAGVSFDVAFDFLVPKVDVRSRPFGPRASLAPVSETAVNKDRSPVFGQNDIRNSGQIFAMQPEAIPHSMERCFVRSVPVG